MPELIARGSIRTAEAFFSNGAGDPEDPVDPLLSVIDATGATFINLVTPDLHPGVGHYQHQYLIPPDGPNGAWQDEWLGVVDGQQTGPVEDGFTVVPASAVIPPSPNAGTCAPWATEDDMCAPCAEDYDSELAALLPGALQAASDLLYVRSGHQFPGLCTTTVRPAGHEDCAEPGGRWQTPGWSRRVSEIVLGSRPLVQIIQVVIDGAVLDPSEYEVQGGKYLVRRADADGHRQSWPNVQRFDLPDTEVGTWSVTYVAGREPPLMGVTAAAVLACELALACLPANDKRKCRIPRNVQAITRNGITIVMAPSDFLSKNKIGIWEVDLFLGTYNPNGQRRSAIAMSPDVPSRPRRTS